MPQQAPVPEGLGGSLFVGDELGLQYAQSLAEQLAEMCMSPQPELPVGT